jgi:hypothetical protein
MLFVTRFFLVSRVMPCKLIYLYQKGQRTVYRLTLVTDFNTQEVVNYAGLVRRGTPDFIEVKVLCLGLLYCCVYVVINNSRASPFVDTLGRSH